MNTVIFARAYIFARFNQHKSIARTWEEDVPGLMLWYILTKFQRLLGKLSRI